MRVSSIPIHNNCSLWNPIPSFKRILLLALYITKEMVDDCEDVELRTRVTMSELTIFCIYIGVLAVGNDSNCSLKA